MYVQPQDGTCYPSEAQNFEVARRFLENMRTSGLVPVKPTQALATGSDVNTIDTFRLV